MNILRNSRILGIIIAIFSLSVTPNAPVSAQVQGQYIDYNMFYNELAPYGNWYNDPQYGFVWQPNAGPNFRPYYTNGHWAMTEYGNMWVSNYPWGWATFHYGRWFLGNWGWVWVPGQEWAPAWVEWRESPGYYGWAPMGPGMSISMSLSGRYNTPSNWFVFVNYNNMYSNNFSYYNRPSNFSIIFNTSLVLNNSYRDNRYHYDYAYGPRRDQYQYHTNRPAPVYRVNDRNTPTSSGPRGNNISVYRPNVNTNGMSQGPRDVRTPNPVNNNTTTGGRTPANTNQTGTYNNSRNPSATNNNLNNATNNTSSGSRVPANNSNAVAPSTNVRPSGNATSTQQNAPRTTTTTNNTSTNVRQTAPVNAPVRNTTPATSTNATRTVAPSNNSRTTSPAPAQQVAPARSSTPAPSRQAAPASPSRSSTAPSTQSRVVR